MPPKSVIDQRADVFETAARLVDDIQDQYPFEKHSLFRAETLTSSCGTSVENCAEQHVNVILRVADWLCENEEL